MPESSTGVQKGEAGDSLQLRDGSRIGVIGGGPAGSFFGFFLLQIADRIGLKLEVDIYEPRDFSLPAPRGCNMCGGIISESLAQSLATEGVALPNTVIQRRIDSYALHMDVGSVRIETPLKEKRIAAVHRGGGPRGPGGEDCESFDGFMLDQAVERGARLFRERVTETDFSNGRPRIRSKDGTQNEYDLLAVATGINTASLKLFESLGLGYKPPRSERASITEFYLGLELTRRYIGSSMHVFLLPMPGIEFAALIPKSDYVSLCLLGEKLDRDRLNAFLDTPEVRECLPPHFRVPEKYCHCAPWIAVSSAKQPFADRVVFIGDCGTSRLYKDGIGAAYRTAKAAATTAIFRGLSSGDFRRHYWPVCRSLRADNRIGRIVFAVVKAIRNLKPARKGLWKMVSREQHEEGGRRRMSVVLWDTFTGSAPYRRIFRRALHPAFLGRFGLDIASNLLPARKAKKDRRWSMVTGHLGKHYKSGDVIYRQGEVGDCMYVIQRGEVEVVQRDGEKEFCVSTLGPGDFFGEMALFENHVRNYTVRALEKATIMTLEKRTLVGRILEDPSMALRMMERMSKRIRDLEGTVIRMGSVMD